MSASETSKEDRQLPASERRLQQAREEGQVARSRDLVHVAAIGALMVLFLGLGPWLATQAQSLVATGLRFDKAAVADGALMLPRLSHFAAAGLWIVLPIVAGMAALLGAACVAVGGWNFTLKALEPKFSRVNPMLGLGRMVERRQLLGHLKLVLLAGALLACAWLYLSQHAGELNMLARMSLGSALATGFGWLTGGLTLLLGAAFVAALADVPMQLFNHRAELRMSTEELRQENRESEGDPQMKGQRRRRQRELSRGRMLAAVPAASVIITNPTHYAVALRYDEGSMGAPRIVAMGADHLALKIREVARASRVPVLEAPPLARALYSMGRIDGEVPVELYTAVAQVLAWVFRLRTAVRPPPLPEVDVPRGLDPLEAASA